MTLEAATTETPEVATTETPQGGPARESVVNDSEVLARTAERLNKVFGDGPAEAPAGETGETGETGESEIVVEDENKVAAPEDGAGGGDTEQDATGDEEAAESTDPPTLPDSHRRSLQAKGWTDEDISHALETRAEEFLRAAEDIHAARSQELAEWAAMGRSHRMNPAAGLAEASAPSAPAPEVPAASESQLALINEDELIEEFGEDAKKIVGPVNRAIQAINKVLPEVQQVREQAKQQEQQNLVSQINTFFEQTGEVDRFGGNDLRQLSQEQVQARNQVLETADALSAGARLQGRQMSTQEALQAAYDLHAGPVRRDALLDSIRSEIKKRGRGVTVKPVRRKSASLAEGGESGRPASKEELEARTKARLARVFGN